MQCFATCSAMGDANGDITTTHGGEQQPEESIRTQSGKLPTNGTHNVASLGSYLADECPSV